MRSSFQILVLFGICISGVGALSAPTKSYCNNNVRIEVAVSAQNYVLPSNLDTASIDVDFFQNFSKLSKHTVNGTYIMAGQFCEPVSKRPARENTLQVLVHGFSYTRRYWMGDGLCGGFDSSDYSWVAYASKQGYPTLAIDRICNGDSSKLQGALECQFPVNSEALNAVIEAARAGKIGNRQFSKIILVTHSLGSLIANVLQRDHPDAVDSYIMTGFTSQLLTSVPGDAAAAQFVPAAIEDPFRYGTLLDPTYVLINNKQGIEGLFFFGQYAPVVAEYDFAVRTTATVGEFATALLGQQPAPAFTGSLLVMNGQEDQVFCARSLTDPLVGYRGDCGQGQSSFSARTRDFYPNVKRFEWRQVVNTGHCMNLHYTAAQTFSIAHNFLETEGY